MSDSFLFPNYSLCLMPCAFERGISLSRAWVDVLSRAPFERLNPLLIYEPSGDEGINDISMHIGQAKVTPLESVGEFGMIKTKETEQGGMKVVDMDRIY